MDHGPTPIVLSGLCSDVFRPDERNARASMLREDLAGRVNAVNAMDRRAWESVDTREAWLKFAGPRIAALRRSLGEYPTPGTPEIEVTNSVGGDGYRIDNVLYDTRPGVRVSANLYLPSAPRKSMPAMVLVHSHHNARRQGELQDMGMLWARKGCAVLVMDQLGYGERRQHAPGPRQDYWFRYITGCQLQLIGDSLMGWMVWDIMRGIDILVAREDVDPERVVVIGSVAGGGDPAAVAAALDDRVACVVPFNFGGPQPESEYPLPDDAQQCFNYVGWGGWETTRNLAFSARDGFLPWEIVGSVAPRYLIYAHEFSWDRERDPVWARLRRIYGFFGAEDRLGFAHGKGLLTGTPPEASHCNNVGAFHREMIHPLLASWFGIGGSEEERRERRADEELAAVPSGRHTDFRPLHRVLGDEGDRRASVFRKELEGVPPVARREALQLAWSDLLGAVAPRADVPVLREDEEVVESNVSIRRFVFGVERDVVVPAILLVPESGADRVVIAVCQEGKHRLLSERRQAICQLLEAGTGVCLADLSGTGETAPGLSRRPRGGASALAATELMLGQTLIGSRLRDLRTVMAYLRDRYGMRRFALWGDSFAPTNPADFHDPPMGDDAEPAQCEPMGGLLALLAALYEDDVSAVVCRRSIPSFRCALEERFLYLPYDVIVPGALTAGDLCDLVAALCPRPVWISDPVDARNCPMTQDRVEVIFQDAKATYAQREAVLRFGGSSESDGTDIVRWLTETFTASAD